MRQKMPKINNLSVRNLRRTQAEERQAKYDAMTPIDKLERIKTRRGASAKEQARIEATFEPEEATK